MKFEFRDEILDKQNLSKYKYIWRVYRGSEGKIHKEKFPVIYANGTNTYYKAGRSTALNTIATDYIKDCPTQKDVESVVRHFHSRYYWNIPDEIDSMFAAIKKAVEDENERKYIDETIKEYRLAKVRYERAKKAYDALPDEAKSKMERCKSEDVDPIEFWRNG